MVAHGGEKVSKAHRSALVALHRTTPGKQPALGKELVQGNAAPSTPVPKPSKKPRQNHRAQLLQAALPASVHSSLPLLH